MCPTPRPTTLGAVGVLFVHTCNPLHTCALVSLCPLPVFCVRAVSRHLAETQRVCTRTTPRVEGASCGDQGTQVSQISVVINTQPQCTHTMQAVQESRSARAGF